MKDKIRDELHDQLLENYGKPEDLTGPDGRRRMAASGTKPGEGRHRFLAGLHEDLYAWGRRSPFCVHPSGEGVASFPWTHGLLLVRRLGKRARQ